MRALIGRDLAEAIDADREEEIDWLNAATRKAMGLELAQALDRAYNETVEGTEDMPQHIKTELKQILYRDCARVWRAKFDLGSPAHLPPM